MPAPTFRGWDFSTPACAVVRDASPSPAPTPEPQPQSRSSLPTGTCHPACTVRNRSCLERCGDADAGGESYDACWRACDDIASRCRRACDSR